MRHQIASSSVLALGMALAGNAAAQQYGYGSDADYGSGIVRCECGTQAER